MHLRARVAFALWFVALCANALRANALPAGAFELPNIRYTPGALRAAVCSPYGYRGLHLSIERAERAIAHDWMHTPVALPTAKRRGTIVPIRRNVHGVPLAVFWTDTTSPGIANVPGDAASESVPYRRR